MRLCVEGGGNLTGVSGAITSANYPDAYPEKSCVWRVRVARGSQIRFTVTQPFGLRSGGGDTTSCEPYDSLVVRPLRSSAAPRRFCFHNVPNDNVSAGPVRSIRFYDSGWVFLRIHYKI